MVAIAALALQIPQPRTADLAAVALAKRHLHALALGCSPRYVARMRGAAFACKSRMPSVHHVLVALVLFGRLAAAEGESAARLSGRVVDGANGRPVEGAEVYVTDAAGRQRVVITGREGQYALDVAPGPYQVMFSYGVFHSVGQVTVEPGRPATLDGKVDSVQEEVIVIRDMMPPKVPPKPVNFSERKAPPYSDAAILQDAWTRAWMVIDISPTGDVKRFKFLKRPGYDLDAIAASEVFKLKFEPARDDSGKAIETWLVWGIEWPSNGYLNAHGLPRTTMPPIVGFPPRALSDTVPCLGSGPMSLSSIYPTYRDCSIPDLSRMSGERWIVKPGA